MKIETCNQFGCESLACVKVHWPGKVPPPVYCVKHAQQAVDILNAMGTPVNLESYQPKIVK